MELFQAIFMGLLVLAVGYGTFCKDDKTTDYNKDTPNDSNNCNTK